MLLSRDSNRLGKAWSLLPLVLLVMAGAAIASEIEEGVLDPVGLRTDIPQTAPEPDQMFPTLWRESLGSRKASAAAEPFEPGADGVADSTADSRLPSAPSRGNSFLEIPDTGSYPPDGGIAAGPNYLVAVANGAVAYLTKDGERVFQTSLSSFFGTVGAFDPRALFDRDSNRFILAAVSGRNPTDTTIHLAISTSTNPRDGWCHYSLDGDNPANTWADFPTLGVNHDAIFVAANQFDTATPNNNFVTNQILWLGKAATLTCTTTSLRRYTDLQLSNGTAAIVVQPAHTMPDAGGAEFLASADDIQRDRVRIWRVNDPLGTPSFTPADALVGAFNFPPAALQPGGGAPLDTGDVRLLNLIARGDVLYMAHNGAGFTCGAGSCSVLHWKEIAVGTFPSTSTIQDSYFGLDGSYYFYPGMAVNHLGDIAISFGRSSTTEYASLRHTGRLGTAPPNQLEGSALLQAGTANYQELDSRGRNRWGDYFGASSAWCDATFGINKGAWVEGEYATGTTSWNKWVANTFSQPSPANNLCPPGNFLTIPLGPPAINLANQTATYATFEEQDLIQSCGASLNTGSVWYYFGAPQSGSVTINTIGSDYDTVLSVYSEAGGVCNNLVERACNDDYSSLQSQITFNVVAGTVYNILVSAYGNDNCAARHLVLNGYLTTNPETNCFDGVDNDGDGQTDCADADCNGQADGGCDTGQLGICAAGLRTCVTPAEICDPINTPQSESPPGGARCTDGLDNDCDGLTDSADPSCQSGTTIQIPPVCGAPGAELLVPVLLNKAGEDVASLGFTLNYPTPDFCVANPATDVYCSAAAASLGFVCAATANCATGTVQVTVTPPIQIPIPQLPQGEVVDIILQVNPGANAGAGAMCMTTAPECRALPFGSAECGDTGGFALPCAGVSGCADLLPCMQGECNGDNNLTSADVTCIILRLFNQIPSMSPCEDCNQDGTLTTADVTCSILCLFGLCP